MRQTLFYIPMEIFGLPLFGIGLLFWLILAFVIWRMIRAMFITKKNDDFWSDAFVGMIAVLMVAWVAPALNHGQGLPIRGYGVFLMLAILLSVIVVLFRAKKKWNIPPEMILSIVVVEVVFGLIGARLFYVLEYWPDFMERTPEGALRLGATIGGILNLTQGGLVVFGSIIGGIVATLVYLRMKKLPLWGTMDIFAPALMLGIAIGRLGCFMNGCCFGGVCDTIPPGVVFPVGSPAHFHQMEHGEASLGGFYLMMPKKVEEKEVNSPFHFKESDSGLMATTGEPIVVASVDEGSNPAKAGLKPEMTILRVGAFRPANGEATEAEIKAAPMVTPVGTRGLLTFLYDNGFSMTLPTIVFDVRMKSNPTEDSPNASGEEVQRIAFRAGPFEVRPVHPTQLYSASSAFLLFCLLMFLDRFFRRDGVLFAIMLIFYSINRFGLETIRTDESSFMGSGLSVSQCVSLATILFAVFLLIYRFRKKGPPAYEGMFPMGKES